MRKTATQTRARGVRFATQACATRPRPRHYAILHYAVPLALAGLASCSGEDASDTATAPNGGRGPSGVVGDTGPAASEPLPAYASSPPLEQSPVLPLVREAQALAKVGRTAEAERVLRRANRQAPDQPEVALLLGQLLIERAQGDGGTGTLDRALATDGFKLLEGVAQARPDHVPTLLALGWSYCLVQDRAAARPVLERALELAPGNRVGSRRLAGLLLVEGLAAEAEPLLAPLVAAGMEDVELLTMWGMVHEAAERLEDALAAYERAVAVAPFDATARLKLAAVLGVLGRDDEATAAQAEYDQLVAQKGEARALESEAAAAEAPSALWLKAGILRAELADDEAAGRDFERAVRTDPSNVEALTWLGLTHAKKGALRESRGALEEAVRLAPSSLDARRILGEVLLALGEAGPAVSELQAALELVPANLEGAEAAAMTTAIGALLERAQAESDAAALPPAADEGAEQAADG